MKVLEKQNGIAGNDNPVRKIRTGIIKKNPLSFILTLLLVTELVLIVIANFRFGRDYVDGDTAKLYVHAMEMWKNKRVVIPGWLPITTLEWDCSLFLAVPIYGLTGNIYAAFAISNIVFLLLTLWVVSRIFYRKEKKNTHAILFVCVLVCIPYAIGMLDYFNMMFFGGSQYNIKVLVPFVLIALFNYMEQNLIKTRSGVILSVLYFWFLFVTSFSSGIYVLACGITPVLAGYLIYKLYSHKKIEAGYFGYVVGTCLSGIAGLVLNSVCEVNAKGNSMTFCSVGEELRNNIFDAFFGLFELVKAVAYDYETVQVLSLRGIDLLVRMFFVLLLLFCAYKAFQRIRVREAEVTDTLFLAIFVWNMFVLCITRTKYGSSTFEYRYHLMGLYALLCLCGRQLGIWYEECKGRVRYVWTACTCAIICFMMVTSFGNIYKYNRNPGRYDQLCQYVEEQGYQYAYMYSDSEDTELCRLVGYGKGTEYLVIPTWTDTSQVYDYYEKYHGAEIVFDNAVLIMHKGYTDFGESVELYGHMYHLTHENDLYYFYE